MADVRRELADATASARELLSPTEEPVEPRIDHTTTPFRLEARPSPIHRFGIFAAQTIPANVRVIEYTGERIGYREAERRRERPYLYLFWVAPGRLIDGAVGGSGAEFINHSCAPNAAGGCAGIFCGVMVLVYKQNAAQSRHTAFP